MSSFYTCVTKDGDVQMVYSSSDIVHDGQVDRWMDGKSDIWR